MADKLNQKGGIDKNSTHSHCRQTTIYEQSDAARVRQPIAFRVNHGRSDVTFAYLVHNSAFSEQGSQELVWRVLLYPLCTRSSIK